MTRKIARAKVPGLRQRTQYTCGATSLTAALQALGKDVTEDQVNKIMGASPGRGVRWEEILATCQYFGCRGSLVVPATLGQLKKWTRAGNPVIIAWNPESRPWSHVSVVLDVDENENIHVMDPNIPDPDEFFRVVPRAEFFKAWGEQWGDKMIIRRPGMKVELEIDEKGQQMRVASRQLNRLQHLQKLSPGDTDAAERFDLLSKRRGLLHISREATRIFVRDIESGKVFTLVYDPEFAKTQSRLLDDFSASLHGKSFQEAAKAAGDFTQHAYDNYPDAEVSFVNKIYRRAAMSGSKFPCISAADMERRLTASLYACPQDDEAEWMDNEEDEGEKEGRFEEGKKVDVPKYLRDHGNPEAAKKWVSENERNRDQFKSARFPKGEKVDVPAYFREKGNDEAADAWIAMNEEHGEKFKTAYGPLVYQDHINRVTTGGVPGGLYGYKKSTQKYCESAAQRVYKFAQKLAKQVYGKDERVSQFLAMHAKRSDSLPSKILMASMRNLGPKFASEKRASVGRHVRFRDQYLKDFFAEKNIPSRVFEVVDEDGVPHSIPNDVVVEHIALTSGRELEQIKNTLRKIDFKNGDVNHFLEHLAKGIAAQATGKFASDKTAARKYGLYGFPDRTARLGLGACVELREEVGRIAYGLHSKRTDAYSDIEGFFQNHSKQAECQASKILLASYPEKS